MSSATLTTKLALAFGALALVASLPGASLLLGVSRLQRLTRQASLQLDARDGSARARAAAFTALSALQSHALFPKDPSLPGTLDLGSDHRRKAGGCRFGALRPR